MLQCYFVFFVLYYLRIFHIIAIAQSINVTWSSVVVSFAVICFVWLSDFMTPFYRNIFHILYLAQVHTWRAKVKEQDHCNTKFHFCSVSRLHNQLLMMIVCFFHVQLTSFQYWSKTSMDWRVATYLPSAFDVKHFIVSMAMS